MLSRSDFNTGQNMITGRCGERNFFLGPSRSFSCGTLIVETKHSSATFTTPEWQATARGNFAYGRLAGPEHRIDLSLRATAPVTLGQTHGAASPSRLAPRVAAQPPLAASPSVTRASHTRLAHSSLSFFIGPILPPPPLTTTT